MGLGTQPPVSIEAVLQAWVSDCHQQDVNGAGGAAPSEDSSHAARMSEWSELHAEGIGLWQWSIYSLNMGWNGV